MANMTRKHKPGFSLLDQELDHIDEYGQRGIAERVAVDADEHAHQIALLDPLSNEEQNQAYEATEVHDINLGLQVGTSKTATEDVVVIQLHNSCSTAPRGTPEMLALGSGGALSVLIFASSFFVLSLLYH